MMPSLFLPSLPLGPQLRKIRKIRFKLVVGDEDPFCENNAALARAFAAQKVPQSCISGAATRTGSGTGGRWCGCICRGAGGGGQ